MSVKNKAMICGGICSVSYLCLYLQVADAQVAMRLYTMHRSQWEKYIKEARQNKKNNPAATEKRTALISDSVRNKEKTDEKKRKIRLFRKQNRKPWNKN